MTSFHVSFVTLCCPYYHILGLVVTIVFILSLVERKLGVEMNDF